MRWRADGPTRGLTAHQRLARRVLVMYTTDAAAKSGRQRCMMLSVSEIAERALSDLARVEERQKHHLEMAEEARVEGLRLSSFLDMLARYGQPDDVWVSTAESP